MSIVCFYKIQSHRDLTPAQIRYTETLQGLVKMFHDNVPSNPGTIPGFVRHVQEFLTTLQASQLIPLPRNDYRTPGQIRNDVCGQVLGSLMIQWEDINEWTKSKRRALELSPLANALWILEVQNFTIRYHFNWWDCPRGMADLQSDEGLHVVRALLHLAEETEERNKRVDVHVVRDTHRRWETEISPYVGDTSAGSDAASEFSSSDAAYSGVNHGSASRSSAGHPGYLSSASHSSSANGPPFVISIVDIGDSAAYHVMRDRLISVRNNTILECNDIQDFNALLYYVLDLAYRRYHAARRYINLGSKQDAMNRAATTALKLMVVFERGVVYPWSSH